jgi:hypothetical protein
VVFDGSFGGDKAELDGNASNGCFTLSSPGGGGLAANPLVPQANNSRVENFVIHNCQGNGVSLNGHGYVVFNNTIGLDPADAASPNVGDGVSVSANLADGNIPDLSGVPLPDKLADLPAILALGDGCRAGARAQRHRHQRDLRQ